MIYVTKADGSKQEFQKRKVISTCIKMHANLEEAKKVADKVESEIYDGISTKKVLKLVFKYLKEYRPEVRHKIDLREAIALLRPKDFEKFVALLLKEKGYEVITGKIISGKCVDHEIDAIATKGKEKIYVEIKHHLQPHTYTGLKVFLAAQATFEDLKEGYKEGKNKFDFKKALVVCNTKISEHAKRYAVCRGIEHIGWGYPVGYGLEQMIDEKKLYPITFLKGLDASTEEKLADSGIILLKQLVGYSIKELQKKTKITKKKLEVLVKKAKEILQV